MEGELIMLDIIVVIFLVLLEVIWAGIKALFGVSIDGTEKIIHKIKQN